LSQYRKILIVDDDPLSLNLLSKLLISEGYGVSIFTRASEALSELKRNNFDLLILDLSMPEVDGSEFLKTLRGQVNYTSVVFLSAHREEAKVVSCLDAGANDYIQKPIRPHEFLARVRAQLRLKDLHDELDQANQKLKLLADTDDVTGLFNMRSLYQKLDFEIERAKRFGRSVGVVMMDMDYFKTVNDSHNHLFGSFVLAEVGRLIKKHMRNIDIAARYGGDEFLMVLTETNEAGMRAVCERLRTTIAAHLFELGEDRISLTASFGFAVTPVGGVFHDARGLVKDADLALYEAKEKGRNRVCSSQEISLNAVSAPCLDRFAPPVSSPSNESLKSPQIQGPAALDLPQGEPALASKVLKLPKQRVARDPKNSIPIEIAQRVFSRYEDGTNEDHEVTSQTFISEAKRPRSKSAQRKRAKSIRAVRLKSG
jgi:diguanylate cyclase (GGDEF)-like protein